MEKLFKKRSKVRKKRISIKNCGGDIILIYRLTEEEPEDNEKSIGDGSVFSLTVTKVYCKGEKREVSHLYDISRSRIEAERIFETVSRAVVTPCNAAEIVGDLIGIPR